MVDLHWFRRPSAASHGTLNACFQFLDRMIVTGRSDDQVIDDGTTAMRLLEEVAAVGGVLVGFSTGVGERVGVASADLEDPRRRVVVLLALARIGAVAAPEGRVRVIDEGIRADGETLDWENVVRLGRTDPAVCTELGPQSRSSTRSTVLELCEALAVLEPPCSPEELLGVLDRI